MAEEDVGTRATPAEESGEPAGVGIRAIAIALIAAGVALILVSVFAHRLGLGPSPGFGWKKLSGTVLGVALAVAGVLLWRGLVGPADDASADDAAGAGADAPTEPRTRGIE